MVETSISLILNHKCVALQENVCFYIVKILPNFTIVHTLECVIGRTLLSPMFTRVNKIKTVKETLHGCFQINIAILEMA